MKILTIILSLSTFISANCFSQNQFDVRKVKWGMTQQEVLNSELPRVPSTKNVNKLLFENVILGDMPTVDASLYYTFTNGRLSEVTYTFNRTYQPMNMTLFKKVKSLDPLFEFITKKKMELLFCWELEGPGLFSYEKNTGDTQCGFDEIFLTKVEKVARENKAYEAQLHYKGDRSRAWVRFNFDNSDAVFKDIIGWATFTPQYNVKKETNDSGF